MVSITGAWPIPRSLTVDLRSRRITILLPDGALIPAPMPPGLTVGWDGLARSHVDTDAGELSLTLAGGETVSIDLGWRSEGNTALAEKPIVYLDQNHWVALAQALHSPDRLDSRTRGAAVDLIERAKSREVLIPFSSGHLVETVPRGKQRRDVALTMLTLSRGLQMRNPLDVRRHELSAAISAREPRCAEVFTLEPTVLFSEGSDVPTPADFPAAWAELHRRITAASATIATMFEDADDPSEGPGLAARQRWLDTYRAVARSVHSGNLSPAETRLAAHQILFADLQKEMAHAAAAAAVQPRDFESWLTNRAEADFERAPYVAALQEVLYHRLRNRDDHWKANDLIDMQFLCCAAGYADIVVAERKFGDYLRRTRSRFPTHASVALTLSEAVAALP